MIKLFLSRHWPAIALIAAAFVLGWTVRGWRCDAAVLKTERATEKAAGEMRRQGESSAVGYEQDRSAGYADAYARQERVRTIYRDRIVRSDCAVPDDARRVLSEAVDAANTTSTSKSGR